MITTPDTPVLDATTPEGLQMALAVAVPLLRAGKLVAFPTETVYGLGANALDAGAIEAVFRAKGRPSDNPMIIHLASVEELSRCAVVDRRSRIVAEQFMPGSLTLVLPALDIVPINARAGLPTVALRVPDHPAALALLAESGPLVAPSANLSGRPSPTTAAHVLADLGGRIAAILDGGPCRVGIESTVLDLSVAPGVVLRPGLITAEEIAEILGEEILSGGEPAAEARSPGMRHRHYSPNAEVLFIQPTDEPLLLAADTLVVTTPRHRALFDDYEVRDLRASDIYALFREADARGISTILVYAALNELPVGLLDRVRRAAE